MKQVQGFITEDGTFYQEKTAAKLHETEAALRAAAIGQRVIPEAIIKACMMMPDAIREFIDAKDDHDVTVANEADKLNKSRPINNQSYEQLVEEAVEDFGKPPYTHTNEPVEYKHTQVSFSIPIDPARPRPTPVLDQSVRGRQPMPKVWRSARPEAIPLTEQGDGTGSGRSDAPSVRSDQGVAVGAHSEAEETREGGRAEDFRYGTTRRRVESDRE